MTVRNTIKDLFFLFPPCSSNSISSYFITFIYIYINVFTLLYSYFTEVQDLRTTSTTQISKSRIKILHSLSGPLLMEKVIEPPLN